MKEYNVVTANVNLSMNIPKGCIGTIVMVYDDPIIGYEVEFFNENNETIDIITCEPSSIKLKSDF